MVIVCAVLSIICALVSFWQGFALMGIAQQLGEMWNFTAEREDAIISVMICISSLSSLTGVFGAIERRSWSWLFMVGSAFLVFLSFFIGVIFRHEPWWTFLIYIIVYASSSAVFKYRARVNSSSVGTYVREVIYGDAHEYDDSGYEEVQDDAETSRYSDEGSFDEIAMVSMLMRAKPSSRINALVEVVGDPTEVFPYKGPNGRLYKWYGLFKNAELSSVTFDNVVRLSKWTLRDVDQKRVVSIERVLSHQLGDHTKEWKTQEGKRYLKYLPQEDKLSVVLLGIQGTNVDITIQSQK